MIYYARFLILIFFSGLMQAACDTAFAYAHERKQFETRIGEFQLIQGKVRHNQYFIR